MNQSNWKVHYGINERGVRVSLALLPQDPSPQHWRLKYTGKGRGVALALESPKQNGSVDYRLILTQAFHPNLTRLGTS